MPLNTGLTALGPAFGSHAGGAALYAIVSVPPVCAEASCEQSSARNAGRPTALPRTAVFRNARRCVFTGFLLRFDCDSCTFQVLFCASISASRNRLSPALAAMNRSGSIHPDAALDRGPGRFRVARAAYVDPVLHAGEIEAIFSRCWLFVGHDSEIPGANDFVTRSVAGRPILFLRDRDGAVRCFLNICPHRGAQLVREKRGALRAFSCIYH